MPYTLDLGIIVVIFLVHYFLVLILNKRLITNPNEIISKLFMSVLLYVGASFIYFAFTGRSLTGEEIVSMQVYIFAIGFISILIAATNLLKDFSPFKKIIFTRRRSDKSKYHEKISKKR